MTKNVKLIGIPENNFLCIFIIASSPGVHSFFCLWRVNKKLPQGETSQNAFQRSRSIDQKWNIIIHVKMGISTFKSWYEQHHIYYVYYQCHFNPYNKFSKKWLYKPRNGFEFIILSKGIISHYPWVFTVETSRIPNLASSYQFVGFSLKKVNKHFIFLRLSIDCRAKSVSKLVFDISFLDISISLLL